MTDKDKAGLPKLLQILVPVVSILIALTSLLLGIAARKKELTCTLLSSSSIVSTNPGGINPDIKVEFHGQPIVSLSKLTFSLKNTGSGAVKAVDVTEPVRLVFPSQNKVLNVNVEGTSPQHFTFSVKVDSPSNAVICEFPLLNAGDEAFFSIYVQSARNAGAAFEGRVVDVPQMPYVDKSSIETTRMPRFLSSHAVRMILRVVLICIYAATALLFLWFLLRDVRDEIVYRSWRRAHRSELQEKDIWNIKDVFEVRRRSIESHIGSPPLYGFTSRGAAVGETLTVLGIVAVAVLTCWIVFVALSG